LGKSEIFCYNLLPLGGVAQGDLTGAEAFANQLDEAATRYGSRIWLALATQARGKLAAARQNVETAVDSFKKAPPAS